MQLEYSGDATVFVPSKSQPTSLTESRISASAIGDRGLMIHLKGTGYLLRESKVISETSLDFHLDN